jgi:hypothetical protein
VQARPEPGDVFFTTMERRNDGVTGHRRHVRDDQVTYPDTSAGLWLLRSHP